MQFFGAHQITYSAGRMRTVFLHHLRLEQNQLDSDTEFLPWPVDAGRVLQKFVVENPVALP